MEQQEVVYALFMAYQKLNGEIDNNLIYIFKEKWMLQSIKKNQNLSMNRKMYRISSIILLKNLYYDLLGLDHIGLALYFCKNSIFY